MDNHSDYTNPATGLIDGYAFRPPEVEVKHRAAWERVKHLKRGEALTGVNPIYGRTKYELNEELTKDLSPLEKLVLADGGPSPFGGTVVGNHVEIFND